jgi:hypothetical protein
LLDAIRNLYGVRVAFLVYGEFYGLTSFDSRDSFALLEAALDGCDVAQVNGSFGNIGDDGITKLVDGLKFVQCTNQEALIAFLEPAAGQIDVF